MRLFIAPGRRQAAAGREERTLCARLRDARARERHLGLRQLHPRAASRPHTPCDHRDDLLVDPQGFIDELAVALRGQRLDESARRRRNDVAADALLVERGYGLARVGGLEPRTALAAEL